MGMTFNPNLADTNSRLFAQSTLSVSTSEVALTTGADVNQVQFVRIYNSGPSTIYVGPSLSTYEPIVKNQWFEIAINGFRLYGKTTSGTSSVIVTELG
jgi:hypothetical protein